MNLQVLIQDLVPYRLDNQQLKERLHEISIDSIEVDSRKVKPGALFVCLVGFQVDGHEYANDAVRNGAVAILAQRPLHVDVPVILVPETKRALAFIADRYYNSPTSQLRLIGVTGTNGKTTTTFLLEKVLEDHGKKTGRIGTVNMRIGENIYDMSLTTPDSLELQKAFAQMVEIGSEYAVIEASSHAIQQGRVRGCNFGTVIFTNLTQDHLDYHGTMEEYKRAKGLIFSQLGNQYGMTDPKFAILNADDPATEYYTQITSAQVVTYGIDNPQADILAKNIRINGQGTSFTVECYKGIEDFHLKLLGKFNIYNVLGTIGAGLVEGLTLSQLKESLEQVHGVRGRMEPVDGGQEFSIIVDYAHTPDSLENVLRTIREFKHEGRVICIIGCGGDRDRTKRPIMACISAELADLSIFTSDNPRSEDPEAIIKDMITGVNPSAIPQNKYISIVDRREAIGYAIAQAKKGDIVLIAGKGHETTQKIKDHILPFDDREVALEFLQRKE